MALSVAKGLKCFHQTLRYAQGERLLGISACPNDNALRQRLESLAIRLNDGNRDMTGFAGVDVSPGSGFALVRSAD